jgi:hypothetical protein
MDEGLPNTEAQYDPFQKIAELEQELATSRALMEEYKAKFLYGCLKFEGLKVEFGFPSMGDPLIPPGLGS